MEQPDMNHLAHQFRRWLPEVLYPTVEEAAAANAQRIESNVAFYRENPEGLDDRIAELHEEWDAQRVLTIAAAGASLAGFWMALTRSRFWMVLPLMASAGLLQHGLTRRGPAIDILRRMGIRTRQEIDAEIAALRALEHP